MKNVWRSVFILSSLLLVVPSASFAGNTAAYEEAKGEARTAYSAGQFKEAAQLFQRAFDAEPRGNLLYNIGLCHEKAGDVLNAIAFYERFIEAVPGSAKRAAVQGQLTKLKKQLEGRYQSVTVKSSPPGAIIFVDDKAKGAMGAAPITFRLLPGGYTILAELEGYESTKKAIRVRAGSPTDVKVRLLNQGSVGSVTFLISEKGANVMVDGRRVGRSPITEPIRIRAGTRDVTVMKPGFAAWTQKVTVKARGTQRVQISLVPEGSNEAAIGGTVSRGGGVSHGAGVWPWVTVGVGSALIAGGVVMGLSAADLHEQLSGKHDRNEPIAPQDIDTGNSQVMMTNALLGAGSATIIGGLVWWWLDDGGVETQGNIQAGVGLSPDGQAGLQIFGSF